MQTIQLAAVALLLAGAASAETAKDAWTKLAGAKMAKRPGFQFVERDPKLPNVLIYGDSMAYTPTVQKELKGKANVYRIYCNGGDSGTFIEKVTRMQTTMSNKSLQGHWDFDWDVIHINVGLHDLKYAANGQLVAVKDGKQVNSTETYAKNLDAIVAFLKKQAPKAKVIFATTTPVPEGGKGRVAGDAKRYNEVAVKTLGKYPEILYAFTKPHQPEWWTRPGNVHFKSNGYTAQGKEVARVIAAALKR